MISAKAQVTVTGVVSDNTAQKLPGVNVLIEGTTKGTITGIDGNYQIEVAPDAVLTFSFIGFQKQTIEVQGRSQINVEMTIDAEELDEVVVVGYGEMKRSDLSGASVSLSADELQDQAAITIDQAIQGKATGVTVNTTSGNPGGSVSIRIRGTSTINSNAEPLYVIDGVPVPNATPTDNELGLIDIGGGGRSSISGMAGLSPGDIESIEVLKDASATAIYGSRAANGVILITTKQGRAGEAKFEYDTYYGVQKLPKKLDMMNLREFAQFHNTYSELVDFGVPRVDLANPSRLGKGTDWQDELFREASIQSHQLNIAGGTEKSKYALSLGYLDQEGIAIGSGFERLSARLNSNSKLKKWVSLTTNFSYSKTNEQLNLFNGEQGVVNLALLQTPDLPVRNLDGTYAGANGLYSRVNPIAKALNETNSLERHFFSYNVGLDFNILPSLTFHTDYGGNTTFNNTLTFQPTYDFGEAASNDQNKVSHTKGINNYWQTRNFLTFNKKFFDKHNINAMIGFEASEYTFDVLRATGTDLPTDIVPNITLAKPKTIGASAPIGSGALRSQFTRFNYNYDNRYLMTFTLRRDESSNFGPNNQSAIFPAVAVSWRVSNEDFMSALEQIDNFKIRAGWGQTGNQNIPGYAFGTSLRRVPTGLGLGFAQNNFQNENVQWEKAEQINLGTDIDFLDSRFRLILDWYDKYSTDMLLQPSLPSLVGTEGGPFSLNSQWENLGEIRNRGIEISLSADIYRNNDGGFRWETSLVYSRNKNRLVTSGLENDQLEGTMKNSNEIISLVKPGDEIGAFYGYVVDGIYRDKDDLLNSPIDERFVGQEFNRTSTVWVGDIKFKDISGPDGIPDGVINEYDRTKIGSPQADFTGALNNQFSYKGIDLGIFLTFSYGNDIYNYLRQGRSSANLGIESATNVFKNQLTSVLNHARYEPVDPETADENYYNFLDQVRIANPNTHIPRLDPANINQNQRVSDRYIEDGSYVRIQSISLSYTFPKKLVERMKLRSLKVYAVGRNLYTFTKYSGYDPEIGQDGYNTRLYGVDNGRYPAPRVYTAGFKIGF